MAGALEQERSLSRKGRSREMKNSESNIFIQFMATLFGGAIFVYVAIWTLLLNFGFDSPDYTIWIILTAAIIGISLTEIFTRRTRRNFHLVNLGLFALITIFLLLYIGQEDWQFVIGLSAVSLIYAAVPAVIYIITRHWQKLREWKLSFRL